MGVQAKPSQVYKKIKKELINPANMSAAGTPILIAICFLDLCILRINKTITTHPTKIPA